MAAQNVMLNEPKNNQDCHEFNTISPRYFKYLNQGLIGQKFNKKWEIAPSTITISIICLITLDTSPGVNLVALLCYTKHWAHNSSILFHVLKMINNPSTQTSILK